LRPSATSIATASDEMNRPMTPVPKITLVMKKSL